MHVIGHSKSIPSKLKKNNTIPRGPINIGQKFIYSNGKKNTLVESKLIMLAINKWTRMMMSTRQRRPILIYIYTHWVVCIGRTHIHTLVFCLIVEELASGSYKLAKFFAGMLAVNPFVFPGIYRSKMIKENAYDLVTQVFLRFVKCDLAVWWGFHWTTEHFHFV